MIYQFHVGNPVLVIADYSRNHGNYGHVVALSGIANWYVVEFPNDGDHEYLHGGMIRIAEPVELEEGQAC